MAFVESYFDAWNRHDARLVAEHLTDDGTYCDIPSHEQHSRDELMGSLTRFFASNNHQYKLIGEVLKGEATIAFQYRVSQSDASADNFFGSELMTIDGDGAIRILDYYSLPGQLPLAHNAQFGSNGAFTRKYTKSGLSEIQMESYKQRLAKLMHIEMTFLQPERPITIPAERFIPVSIVLNVLSSTFVAMKHWNGVSASIHAHKRCWPFSSRPSFEKIIVSPFNSHSPLRMALAYRSTFH